MIKFLFLSFLIFAQIPKIAFNLKVVGNTFEFTPAAKHHFNDQAPNNVEFKIKGKIKKAGPLEFSKEMIKVKFNAVKDCQVIAQLYVCDDKESYCVPRKQTYSCDGKSLSFNNDKNDTKIAASEKEGLFFINDSKSAFEEAQKQNKLLLIDFFGIWCPPCNMLDETIFNTSEFKKFKKQFVFLKMDADNSVSWDLKSKYKITGYPTVVMVKENGDEVLRVIGSRKPKAFYKEMINAIAWKNFNESELKKVNQEVSNPKMDALEKASDAKDYEKVIGLSQEILKDPKLLDDVEMTRADLFETLADAYENLKNESQSKLYFKKAFDEYTHLIRQAGLNEKTERGYNLERIYCLWKSGDYHQAEKYYSLLEKRYPKEFTFYYQHAHLLKSKKTLQPALDKALKAFKYSYGDNKLRVTGLIAELQLELGHKEEALKILDEVISSFQLPGDKAIRTHRYYDKLKSLREKAI